MVYYGDGMKTCTAIGCVKPAVARGMCNAHWTSWRRSTQNFTSRYGNRIERFWRKVDKRGADECWPWRGTLEVTGYGQFFAPTGMGQRLVKAHRFAYELLVGPIPAGMDLDHICHTRERDTCDKGDACPHRRCVNPAHLEPVTERTNVLRSRTASAVNARKTHCVNGHALTGENLFVRSDGGRRCRECKRAAERARYARRRLPAP